MQSKLITILALAALAFAPAKKQSFQFKLEKGKSYTQSTTMKSVTKQTMQGQTMESENTIVGALTFRLKEEGKEGNVYEVTYDALEMETAMMGQKQSFSSDTAALPMVDPMSRVFAHLTGQAFTANIALDGTVSNVQGMEKILENAAAKAGNGADMIVGQLSENFGNESLGQSIEMLTAILPTEPVDIGDTWKSTTSGSGGMPILIHNTYTFSSLDGGIATFNVNSEVEVDPENSSMEMQGMDAQYFLEGSRTGTMKVEMKTGWLTEAELTDDIFGSITISPNAQLPQGMTIPIEIKNVTTVNGK